MTFIFFCHVNKKIQYKIIIFVFKYFLLFEVLYCHKVSLHFLILQSDYCG